jgi:glycosyltransferase involved in cell wall biosynthesis
LPHTEIIRSDENRGKGFAVRQGVAIADGDLVIFTDVHGVAHYYEVVLLETLSPTATEAMIASGFDLSLYTCTPGGGNRVTVRCRANEGKC